MPSKVNPTHFYPTTPQASSKSMASKTFPARVSRTHPLKSTPGPPGETPQEKVARLREAAARAKAAQISLLDRFLVRGRVWADTAHKVTVLGLIGITGLAGIVTVFALGDMIIYNRRKKKDFMIEQKHLHHTSVAAAREAIANNTATPEQIEFITFEDRLDRIEDERRNRKGIYRSSKEWLLSGLGKEDAAAATSSVEKSEEQIQNGKIEILKAAGEMMGEVKKGGGRKQNGFVDMAKEAWDKEKKLEKKGGMLDQLGVIDEKEKPKSGGWTSWKSWR